ncbi:DotH/IcmK family type IV secretion protein [Vreelandella rituensis]|uniref:Type IV secretion protein DotH n=1 Tax=Vreelandella rituensis TaxID=2282306 RepID=A0A368UAZ7_9GAMM|nr:DotH/IcmK family type IV secretion protein [Halomonas rituensis]RCV93846.1 hypothetical protein DU506_01425 [Halomonas rituensis]
MLPRRYARNSLARAVVCLACLGSFHTAQANEGKPTNAELDARLVQMLQVDQETMDSVRSQMGDRLAPEEIRALRQQLSLEEAARENPNPPTIANKVVTVKRSESPQIDIMERFDTTLVFSDRAGNPLKILSWRISDSESAELIPLHQTGGGSQGNQPNLVGDLPPSQMITEDTGAGGDGGVAASGSGPVTGLIVSPRRSMRSTNITIRVEGETYPIILTIRSHPSTQTERELAYLNELRLDWIVNMPDIERAAGKYAYGEALEGAMLSLLQGIPSPELEGLELDGPLSDQMSLWRDATDRHSKTYYLRMADHIAPWNISIADQSHDRMRGFTVIRLNGAPPKSMGFSANGQYTSISVAE